MTTNSYTIKQVVMGRLALGADLIEGLTAICEEKNITVGMVSAIGALQEASLVCYNQTTQEYESSVKTKEKFEIASLTGNVSLLDGKTFLHLHSVLSGPDGKTVAGHVAPGCKIFLCEYVITELSGQKLERTLDDKTGLNIWGCSL